MKNLYEFSTSAPDMTMEKENIALPLVKLVYESTQPIKDTQKDSGRQLGLSDSDPDVKKFRNVCRKIVQDSEEEELDIQTTPAKICSNDKCKTGLSIEWKSSEVGILCFGCWEYISKFGSFNNYKKKTRIIQTKNFNFLKSPRRNVSPDKKKHANFYSSPIQRRNDGYGMNSGRKRRTVSTKRNYRESSSSGDDDTGDKKRQKSLKNLIPQSKKSLDKTTSMEEVVDDTPLLVKNSLVWALFKEMGYYYSAIVASVQEDTVDVLFFQGPLGHDLPIGNYNVDKNHVEFLDLDSDQKVFMDYKGQKEEFLVSEALSDGALLLNQSKDHCEVLGTRHGVYMDSKFLTLNTKKSLVKMKKKMHPQIFENIYIIFSFSLDGVIEVSDCNCEMEEIKKSFAFRGGDIFEIGESIPENVKEAFIDPLSYTISSGLSELIPEASFPVSRYIHQNLETDRVFEDKMFKFDESGSFVERWKFILECGGAKIESSGDALSLSEEAETWLEQCLIHQFYFRYFKRGDQFDADLFNNIIN